MTYRDDRDADRARIEALEGELASAKQRINELEGTRSQALVVAGGSELVSPEKQAKRKKWLGAPTELGFSRTFDAEFPREKLEDLVETIRQLTGQRGTTELMPSSLSWGGHDGKYTHVPPTKRITIKVKDGATVLEVTEDLGLAASESFTPFVFGIAGSVVGAMFSAILLPPLIPVVLAAGLGGGYGGSRARYKRTASKRAEQFQARCEQLVAAIERELRPQTPVEQVNEAPRGERDRDSIAE